MDDDFRNGKAFLYLVADATGQCRPLVAWLSDKRNRAVFPIGLSDASEFDRSTIGRL
jgi:hypothetical protein